MPQRIVLTAAYSVTFALLAAVFARHAGTTSASADELVDWTGTLTSQRFEPVPNGQPFDVEIFDDTRENLAFREQFLAALHKAGYATAENAPLLVSFATGITWTPKRAEELERRMERQQPTNFEELTFPRDVWREESGPYSGLLFGTGQSAGIPVRDAKHDQLDITAQIRRAADGRVLWQTELTLPLIAPDRPRIARSIIAPIIETIGISVEDRKFEIRRCNHFRKDFNKLS